MSLYKNTLRYTRYKNIQKYFNEHLMAMLNFSLSYECWFDLPSLMQAWIRTIIPSLFVCYAANRHQRLIMFFELFIVLRSLSALRALGFASLCLHNSTNPLRVLSKTQPRLDDEYTYGRKNRVFGNSVV